jgi:hypothetical protein
MSQKNYYTVTGTIFLIITVLHFLRILNGWSAEIGTATIPMWASWVAVLLAGCLAYHGLKRKG